MFGRGPTTPALLRGQIASTATIRLLKSVFAPSDYTKLTRGFVYRRVISREHATCWLMRAHDQTPPGLRVYGLTKLVLGHRLRPLRDSARYIDHSQRASIPSTGQLELPHVPGYLATMVHMVRLSRPLSLARRRPTSRLRLAHQICSLLLVPTNPRPRQLGPHHFVQDCPS